VELPVVVEHVRFHSDDGYAILGVNVNIESEKYKNNKKEIDKLVGEVLKTSVKPQTSSDNFYRSYKATSNLVVAVDAFPKSEKPQGKSYIFCGEFIKHKRYGDQFKADCFYADFPNRQKRLLIHLELKAHMMFLTTIQRDF
jgi:hypothetical protein